MSGAGVTQAATDPALEEQFSNRSHTLFVYPVCVLFCRCLHDHLDALSLMVSEGQVQSKFAC